MYHLNNHLLKISVKKTGAELCNIVSVNNNTEFMWQANPDIWGSHAPNLFPIIGVLKNGFFSFEGKNYHLTKHGFIRNNNDIQLIEQTKNSLTFGICHSPKLLEMYPFKFDFKITFILKNNSIEVKHTVKNMDDKTIYFSLGGHPAFKCPVFEDENYNDYNLEFEHHETSKSYLLNTENSLMTSNTKEIFKNSNTIQLTNELFSEDALVFKDLNSRKTILKSSKNGEVLSVTYKDFKYLGIWAKPNGNFVCIEPWLGLGDYENTNQQLINKEGILSLEPNKTFTASYHIEIHKSHLE